MKTTQSSPKTPRRAAPVGQANGAPETPLGSDGGGQMPSPAERDRMIRDLAYSFFEKRGHAYGHELEDWLRAEAQVMQIEQQAGESAPGEGGASPSETVVRASRARH